jgi:hypothetical protein
MSPDNKGAPAPFDRFRELAKRLVAVPKPELDAKRAEERAAKQARKKHKPA